MRKYFGRWHSFTKSCPQSLLGMQNYAKTLQKNIWLITALTHHSQVKLPEPIPDSVKYVPMQNKPCTKVGYGTVMLFHSHKFCKHSKSVEKRNVFFWNWIKSMWTSLFVPNLRWTEVGFMHFMPVTDHLNKSHNIMNWFITDWENIIRLFSIFPYEMLRKSYVVLR